MPTTPDEVELRLKTWKTWWRIFVHAHYLLGIVGVLSSTLAAALPKDLSWLVSLCAVVSACCFAVIGFVNPDKRYIGLVRAWRVLDVANARWKRGLITEAELLDVMQRCEALATEPASHELPPDRLEVAVPCVQASKRSPLGE